MVSNKRKLYLSGWLKHNYPNEYDHPLKLQNYLFLYEALSNAEGDNADFCRLRGYKRGPAFSDVWENYMKEREAFDQAADNAFFEKQYLIDEIRAKKSAFIVQILSEKDFSEFVWNLNLLKAKKKEIMNGDFLIELDERDFTENDSEMIRVLGQMYPVEMIDNVSVFEMNNHYFLIQKKDQKRLTEQHFDTLCLYSTNERLHNPIYVKLDEKQRLVVD